MPFAPFVGANHHGHSILLRCELLSNEDIETFEWLFYAWMKAMDWSAPKAIITDQCQSIGKGIERIFLYVRHQWCLWHILIKFSSQGRRTQKIH